MKAGIEIEYLNGEVQATASGSSIAILDALEITLAGFMKAYKKPENSNEELAEDLKKRMLGRLEDTSIEEGESRVDET